MGKSALGALHRREPRRSALTPVALFTLEMSKSEVTQRMMCSEAKVESQRLRSGRLAPDDWPRLTAACDRLMKAPIYVDDTGSIDDHGAPLEGASPQVARADLGLIIVDYLQLMASDRNAESRVQEVSQISRALKVLARELEVPILAMSQLSRAVEQRQDKRPILSDLRDSGSIEQDSDLVLFVYRDEYYLEGRIRPARHRRAHPREAPQRADGTVKLSWLNRYAKFADLAAASRPGVNDVPPAAPLPGAALTGRGCAYGRVNRPSAAHAVDDWATRPR